MQAVEVVRYCDFGWKSNTITTCKAVKAGVLFRGAGHQKFVTLNFLQHCLKKHR